MALLKGPGLFTTLLGALFGSAALVWGIAAYQASQTLGELFADNARLRQAITNLTHEEQIGYAKVLDQRQVDGRLETTLVFHETGTPGNSATSGQSITLPGDTVHFDALVVTFDAELVADGQQRALYLWRRIYSDQMAPENGMAINPDGHVPERYADLFSPPDWSDRLLLKDDEEPRFWQAIWELDRRPDLLAAQGVRSVQGTAVYTRMRPGLIYILRFSATGQITIDTVPDL